METEKDTKAQGISPEEIREIRQLLKLSQTEAGELLGGGPSAFTKYENGSVKPSVALVKMLRFLQKRPEELAAVTGRDTKANKPVTTPFDVTSEHVSALKPRDFSALVEKLLSAEALEWNLPLDGIHVASQTNAPDGGEDARIEWQNGPEQTSLLPNRLCQFQLKTGKISPADAGKEILTPKNQLKPMVRKALEKGGSYIMLCSRPYAQKLIDKRLDSIRENLQDQGFENPSVRFHDSSKIALWVNYHPCVAIWLLRKTHPELLDPSFGDWKHWSGRPEHHNSPWVKDLRMPGFREKLRGIVETPKGVARVVGPSGTGKSRLVLEALGPTETEKNSGVKLSDLVLYAVEPETDPRKIKEYAWNLANSRKRTVLIIDRCSEETRIDLANIAKHSDSSLSLVTINWEIPHNTEESENTLVVGTAESSFVENIVKSLAPDIIEPDRQRIIAFSEGDITCARIIAESWKQKGLTVSDNEDFLIQKFLGRDNHEYVYETAMLISALGGVEMENTYGEKIELEEVVKLSKTLSVESFCRAIRKLQMRGVIRQQGSYVILKPNHIALSLAQRQWEEWKKDQWEEILVRTFPERLRTRATRQLAFLNTKPIAIEVVRHICGNRKFWHSPEQWVRNLKILVSLAEIDCQSAVNILEDILNPLKQTEIESITGTARRDLVRMLTKIAFADETFENAAILLFKLARGENENIINNATGQFKSLFPVRLGNTEADSGKRFAVINELMYECNNNSNSDLSIIVEALLEGTKTHHFHRDVGPEIHGSRPALESWVPKTEEEAWNYVKKCVDHLVELAKRPDYIGQQARAGLGQKWHKYILDGLIEDVERWTEEVKRERSYWPEAHASLQSFLEYSADKLEPVVEKRVENLISSLTPGKLDDRIRFLITEMPFGYLKRKNIDHNKMFELQCEELKKLADELLNRKTELIELLPQLCIGQHRNARLFGHFLAEQVPDPLCWKNRIIEAFESTSDEERNSDFLAGYMTGLNQRNPEELEKFKRESVKSPVFAPVLPALTSYTGISSNDVELIIEALEAGLIPYHGMFVWNVNTLSRLQPAEVAPLFDLLLKKEDPLCFSLALHLMYLYSYRQEERLEDLRPQLLLAARYPMMKAEEFYDNLSHEHCYETLMNWIISKGNTDADAREAAIIIAKQLVAEDLTYDGERMIAQVLPDLLSNFAEIIWPLISNVLMEDGDYSWEDGRRSWRVSMILRGEPSTGNNSKPILNLPENILFGWCHASPKIGPAFIAQTFPLLKEHGQETASEEFHPVIKRLLDEFGDREDILAALSANISAFSGWGSEANHLGRYIEPLQSIENHDKGLVRRWVKKTLRHIQQDSSET